MRQTLPWTTAPVVAALLLGLAGCSNCDVTALTAALVDDDALVCSPEDAERDDVDWPCFYHAIEDGEAAWVVYDPRDGPAEDPFQPRTVEQGLAYDGELWVYSVRRLDRCDEFGQPGPCVVVLQARSTGDINWASEDPHGPSFINVHEYEEGDPVEGIHCS